MLLLWPCLLLLIKLYLVVVNKSYSKAVDFVVVVAVVVVVVFVVVVFCCCHECCCCGPICCYWLHYI